MILSSVIQMVDDIKPNAFTNATKTGWLNECEGLVQTEVMLIAIENIIAYDYTEDANTELLVAPPHDKLYWTYLTALIDFANGEYNKYTNTMQLFNSYFGEYMRWYSAHYRPADGVAEELGYYLSAYGIAVKHGYTGTEGEWLVTLKGEQGDSVDMRYENNVVQWQREGDTSWNDLIDMEDIQGEMVTAALNAAQSAVTAAETAQEFAEAAQTAAEAAQTDAETAKDGAVSAKDTAVSAKTDALNAKTAAEAAQLEAEAARTAAAGSQTAAAASELEAETAQRLAETAKTTAVTAKNDAEGARDDAQTAKTAAEAAQLAAAASEQTAAASSGSAVDAKTAAEAAQISAENASNEAVEARDAAQGYYTSAYNKADEAALSAAGAASSAEAAQLSAMSMSYVSFTMDEDGCIIANNSQLLGTTSFGLTAAGHLEVTI